jgi:pentatricopeptide repeat protein
MEPEVYHCFVRRTPQAFILLVQTVQFLSDRVTATPHTYNDILSGLFTAGKLNEVLRIFLSSPSLCMYCL